VDRAKKMIYSFGQLEGACQQCKDYLGADSEICKTICKGSEGTKGWGKGVGTRMGCEIAAAVEKGVPKFPIFGGTPEACPITKEPSEPTMMDNLLAPVIEEAKQEATRIAKPRIEARLKPWFWGLPLAGLAVGLAVGWIAWRK